MENWPPLGPWQKLILVIRLSIVPNCEDRIILKKIVLTGYPFKIHKRSAVARHMFYSPGN